MSADKQKAIKILAERFKNFDLQTEVRGDNRASPNVIAKKEDALIRVEARLSVFEYGEGNAARMVKTSKASGEASTLNASEDEAIYRAISNLGILGDNNE